MSGIPFAYAGYFDRMRGVGTPCDDVVVRTYDADYRAMKFNSSKAKSKFKMSFLTVRKLALDDPLAFPHGGYVGYDDPVNERKKRLYVIAPVEHGSEVHGTYFVADHWSFLVNAGKPVEERLQLHFTCYTPNPYATPRLLLGKTDHYANPLPLEFELPATAAEWTASPLVADRLRGAGNVMHGVLSRPWLTRQPASRGGGTVGAARYRRFKRSLWVPRREQRVF